MVGQIYPTDLQLKKANSADTEAPFLDLDLSIMNGIVPSKIYDKRDDFNFEIVPRSPSYGVYISQLVKPVKYNIGLKTLLQRAYQNLYFMVI